jgi:hypothetical protein
MIIIMIIGFMVLVFIGFVLAVPLAFIAVNSVNQAKDEAKRILESGQITDPKEFTRVSEILAISTNDLEAADLWKKLQELKSE